MVLNAHDVAKRIASSIKERSDIAEAEVTGAQGQIVEGMIRTRDGHWFDFRVIGPVTYGDEDET